MNPATPSFSRRSMLLGGAAALGAAALPVTRRAEADAASPARNLIVVLAYGGWDVTYALDPKPGLATIDVPLGDVQMFGDLPIFTHSTRPAVSEFFAAYAPACAVINGVQVQSIVHSDCTKRLLTGTASDANPDIGAIVAYELGRDLPAPYLVLGPTAYSGPLASVSARAGTVNQIRTLLEPSLALPPAELGPPRFVEDEAEAALMRKYLDARIAREQALRGQHGYNQARYDDFIASIGRGDVLKGFADGFGSDFGFTLDMSVQVQLACDAIERRVSNSVHMEQAFAQWDTHGDNSQQTPMHEQLYGALRELADELSKRPGHKAGNTMFDETVVAVLSEMSRTPKLNETGGKDHWPVTSALVFGAGVRGGQTYGSSGDQLEARNVDLATGVPDEGGTQLLYANLVNGLLELAGAGDSAYAPNAEAFRGFMA